MFKFLKKKAKYTVADMMHDIAIEQEELNALNLDLQYYVDRIMTKAKTGARFLELEFFLPGRERPLLPGQKEALVKSLRNLGFKVTTNEYTQNITIKWRKNGLF